MRTLILTCNTGEGHNSCASAIKEVFDQNLENCVLEDALRFISQGFSTVIERGHKTMYRYFPSIFRWGYAFAERHTNVLAEGGILYRILAHGTENLYHYLENQQYDVVICTHVFSSLMMSDVLRRFPMKVKTYFVATDYTCSPGVKESCLDYYFIPDEELRDEFICHAIPDKKILVSGIPVRQQFYQSHSRKEARENYEIPENAHHMIMMCGSMGCGPLLELVEELSKEQNKNQFATIVCGNNEKLKNKLEKKYKNYDQIRIMGFESDISMLMDSADLYLTKPGGISTTEASRKHLPMVFVNAVAGCEDYNCSFFIKNGCAVTATSVADLTKACEYLLEHLDEREQIKEQFEKKEMINSSQFIFETIKEQVQL